ncbi:MAG: hypothetical protein IRY96_00455 [Burkholderiales bacterium]|nr:hypothetical protein [Burkholderiales bacterium]
MKDFELGVLTSRVDGAIDRIDRFERSVSERLASLSVQMNDFARELRVLAEGYVRREELERRTSDTSAAMQKLYDKLDGIENDIAELREREAAARPLSSIGWEVLRYAVVALTAAMLASVLTHSVL